MKDMTWSEACDRLEAVTEISDPEERSARLQVYMTAPGVLGEVTRRYLLVLADLVEAEEPS